MTTSRLCGKYRAAAGLRGSLAARQSGRTIFATVGYDSRRMPCWLMRAGTFFNPNLWERARCRFVLNAQWGVGADSPVAWRTLLIAIDRTRLRRSRSTNSIMLERS